MQFIGVDIDWEFPNGKPADANDVNWDRGNTCFEYAPEDTDNMLAFIKVSGRVCDFARRLNIRAGPAYYFEVILRKGAGLDCCSSNGW